MSDRAMATVPEPARGGVLDLESALGKTAMGEGARDWPCDRLDTAAQAWPVLASGFGDLARELATADEDAALALAFNGAFWARSAMDIAHAEKLAAGFRSAVMALEPGTRHPKLAAVMDGRAPPDERYLTALQAGPPKSPVWRWPFRIARSIMSPDLVRPSPVRPRPETGEVTILSVGGLLDAHIAESDRRFRLRYPGLWFRSADTEPADRHFDLGEVVLRIARQAARAAGCELGPMTSRWLRAQVAHSARGVETHAGRLRRIKGIPGELWIGSSSDYWARLLAGEVLRRGGTVCAHDHGFGSGWVEETSAVYVLKGFCNRYVAATESQVAPLARLFDGAGFSAAPAPRFAVLAAASGTELPQARSCAVGPGAAMVLPLTIVGERTTLVPYPDDLTCCDLNHRLVRSLQENGHAVALKPHPAFDRDIMEALGSHLGVDVLGGKFEDLAQGYSCIVFCHPLTTTFAWALERALPMVLIDFGFVNWTREGRELVESGARIVPGRRDEHGRLSVDGDELHRALLDVQARASARCPSTPA